MILIKQKLIIDWLNRFRVVSLFATRQGKAIKGNDNAKANQWERDRQHELVQSLLELIWHAKQIAGIDYASHDWC